MRILGNVIWLLLGGFSMALGYFVAGLVMFLLVITIPFGVQAFKLGTFTLWPFGRTLVKKPGAGAASFIGNALWLLFAGWWLAIGHLAAALFLAITIIGIPFAVAHAKLALAALCPFGREIVPLSMLNPGSEAITVSRPGVVSPSQPNASGGRPDASRAGTRPELPPAKAP